VTPGMKRRIEAVDSAPSTRGKRHLLDHLRGERLTHRQAILAKCCECTGYHADGRVDCRMSLCPLYPFMPYREKGVAPLTETGLEIA
jgi:Zn-finger protein